MSVSNCFSPLKILLHTYTFCSHLFRLGKLPNDTHSRINIRIFASEVELILVSLPTLAKFICSMSVYIYVAHLEPSVLLFAYGRYVFIPRGLNCRILVFEILLVNVLYRNRRTSVSYCLIKRLFNKMAK